MSKYDVYGVGNALVDNEFEVPESFFTEYKIEKGLMTLVAHEQQEYIANILNKAYGVKKQTGGGSAGNNIFALTNFVGSDF